MRARSCGILLASLFYVVTAQALYTTSTIYGEDDRVMVGPLTPVRINEAARPVAALFLKADVHFTRTHMYRPADPVGRAYEMCPEERFFDQPSSAECTGFLISPTRVVTAGHCLSRRTPCRDIFFAFDYAAGGYTWDGHQTGHPLEKVYACKRLVAHHNNNRLDFAVIELDRPVVDRAPVKLASARALRRGDQIFALGFPQGIPMIWSSIGHVRRQESNHKVVAQLETSEGNSGSPIFSAATDEVVGLLIEGEDDMRRDPRRGCERSVRCTENGCKGETFLSADVFRRFQR